MSSGFITSPILTSALLALAPSFTPEVSAIWLCSSIMPGVRCLPFASIIFTEVVFGTSILGAILTILPSTT